MLLIFGGTFVLFVVGFSVLTFRFQANKGSPESTLADRDPGEMQREYREILATYDATRNPTGLSPDDVATYYSIRMLLDAIERDEEPNPPQALSQHFDAAQSMMQHGRSGLIEGWDEE